MVSTEDWLPIGSVVYVGGFEDPVVIVGYLGRDASGRERLPTLTPPASRNCVPVSFAPRSSSPRSPRASTPRPRPSRRRTPTSRARSAGKMRHWSGRRRLLVATTALLVDRELRYG